MAKVLALSAHDIASVLTMSDAVTAVEEAYAQKAQGKGLYVLSNYGLEPFARTEKRFPEIFGQMDGMVISSREKVSKPDPAIYRLLLSRYGLQARDCAFIDDRADNVAAAEALGIAGILYTGEDVLK